MLLARINEMHTISSSPFSLTIKEIRLERLSQENNFESSASLTNPLRSNMYYNFTDGVCFDGVKDYCSILKEVEPLLVIEFKAS